MLTSKQLNTKISSVAKRSATMRDDIQIILVNAAGHAFEHRNVSPFDKLMQATTGLNRKLIKKWISDHGFASVQSDNTHKLNKAKHKLCDCNSGAEVVADLLENAPMWWAEADTTPAATALDIAKRVDAISASIDKAEETSREVTIDAEAIREAIAKLSAKLNDHIGKAVADGRFAEAA